jgi:hypothetical protein
MAIRIRRINGITVALCAVETDKEEGDVYLDDNVHHALSTKFGLDWKREGLLKESLADPRLVELMLFAKLRDGEHEMLMREHTKDYEEEIQEHYEKENLGQNWQGLPRQDQVAPTVVPNTSAADDVPF